MRRRTFTQLAILASVVLAGAWLVSARWVAECQVSASGAQVHLALRPGGFEFLITERPPGPWTAAGNARAVDATLMPWFLLPSRLLLTSTWGPIPWNFGFFMPFWLPLSITVITALRLRWLEHHAPKPQGVCACGYDLRGIPAATPCPECGRWLPARPPRDPRTSPATSHLISLWQPVSALRCPVSTTRVTRWRAEPRGHSCW